MSARDPSVRLPSWLIAASLVVLVVATLTYFITSSNDNTDEAAPSAAAADTADGETGDSTPASGDAEQEPPKDSESEPAPGDEQEKTAEPEDQQKPDAEAGEADKKKPEKKAPPEPTPDAVVDVYNNSGITNLAASVSADVRASGFTVGGVDNWYGNIPESTVYYPAGMEEQARLLADDLGLARTMPAISPMSTERLSLILTAAI